MMLTVADFVRPFEQLHDGDRSTPLLEPQQDFRGIWTLGYGSIFDDADQPVTAATPAISNRQAENLLARDSARASANVIRLCGPMAPLWEIALGDFCFNMGSKRLYGSTLRALLQRQQMQDAAAELEKWVFAGGAKARGLVIRRRVARWLVEGRIEPTVSAVMATRAFLLRTLRL